MFIKQIGWHLKNHRVLKRTCWLPSLIVVVLTWWKVWNGSALLNSPPPFNGRHGASAVSLTTHWQMTQQKIVTKTNRSIFTSSIFTPVISQFFIFIHLLKTHLFSLSKRPASQIVMNLLPVTCYTTTSIAFFLVHNNGVYANTTCSNRYTKDNRSSSSYVKSLPASLKYIEGVSIGIADLPKGGCFRKTVCANLAFHELFMYKVVQVQSVPLRQSLFIISGIFLNSFLISTLSLVLPMLHWWVLKILVVIHGSSSSSLS